MFQEGKHNIERINERIEHSEYQSLHHFISVSPWGHRAVLSAVRQDLSQLFKEGAAPAEASLTRLILDESGHDSPPIAYMATAKRCGRWASYS